MLLLLLLSQPLLLLKQEDSLLLLSAPHVLVRCAAPDLYELLLLLLNPLVMDLPGGILYHFPPKKCHCRLEPLVYQCCCLLLLTAKPYSQYKINTA